MKISDFRILSGWIEKYKPGLSKSDSSWDNSYCVRLVNVSLAVNIGKFFLFFFSVIMCLQKRKKKTNNTYDKAPTTMFYVVRGKEKVKNII